jgi:predicted PurR-regulated permease PerM
MKHFLLFIFVIFSAFTCLSQSKEIPFTLEDRDRNIRTEQKVESLRNEMSSLRNEINAKFDNQQQQINSIKEMMSYQNNLFFWAFGILITLVLFTLGYTMWDRRTALLPIREKTESVKEKVIVLENVLKEEAKTNKRLAAILQSYNLL